MIELGTHIQALDFSHELSSVSELMKKARAKTTFWGSRVIEVGGFSGSVDLEALADRVLSVARQRLETDDLTTEERLAGVDIVKTLNRFYKTTDTLIQNSNLFA